MCINQWSNNKYDDQIKSFWSRHREKIAKLKAGMDQDQLEEWTDDALRGDIIGDETVNDNVLGEVGGNPVRR